MNDAPDCVIEPPIVNQLKVARGKERTAVRIEQI